MEKVIKIIQSWYEGKGVFKNGNSEDFENALNMCSKEELIEFIVEHQARGCFKGIVHD